MSMHSNRFRHALLGASAMVSAAAVAGASYAADTRQYDFDMPAQPLTLALKTFGATADQQLIFSEGLVSGRTAPPLKGAYTSDQALAMLLNGSGLIADKTPGGVVTIRSASDPQSGSAAGDGADQGTVQALIVTAQKREENIQDVPIAMSAFTQEDLTRSQVAGGPDLMTQVPNFTFTKTNFSSYSIQIRGIGTQAISATTDAAVAVAFNNTPFIRNRFFEQEFYDLQRVEVLRGPQGTLYGRNATAGVVNIISAKPTFRYEARLSGDISNYNSSRLEGMLNLPLVQDKVALRLAGAWTKRQGYDTNQITGNQIDGRDLWSTRMTLRVEPTDNIHANLIWEHFKEDDDRLRSGKQLCMTDEVKSITARDAAGQLVTFQTGHYDTLPERGQPLLLSGVQATFSQGCKASSLYSPDSFGTPNGLSLPYYVPLQQIGLPVPDLGTGEVPDPYASRTQSHDLRVIESTVDPQYKADTDTVELQLNFDLPNQLSLTSETGYLSDTLFSMQDYNRFNTAPGVFTPTPGIVDDNGTFCDPQVGCANRLVAIDLSTADSRQFSEELRLASSYDGPFNFSLGANFLRYDTEDKYYVFFNSLTLTAANSAGGVYTPGVSDNHQCLKQGLLPPDPTVVYNAGRCVYIDPNPIGNLNDLGHNYFLSKNPYKLISYAVFGEAYYKLAENLKLTAGLRWTVDKKEAPRVPSWVLAGGTTGRSASGAGYSVAEVIHQEWREPTGRLALDWKPDLSFTDETLLYASVAHGYKAGGANPPSYGQSIYCLACGGSLPVANGLLGINAAHPKTFGPEFVNAFEVGAKNTLDSGRLTINADAFYYDYTGYQISQIVDRAAVNLNFDAKVWGLELESDWRPLDNLRFGLKLGYERTRMANGSKAIDLMDRTAGNPDWVVVSPFPTFPSNCILPASLFVGQDVGNGGLNGGVGPDPTLVNLGGPGGGNPGACELAYALGLDPVTDAPYVDLSTVSGTPVQGDLSSLWVHPGYTGFNPATAPNGGAGFFKDLSGHELPNAPHITATLTGDYTLPLGSNWLMTLHTDLYYQSEAWTRVFNTPGYDKLKAYTNVNLAAIFSNEDAGWKVMAYVKNVMDRDSITGAFLNSDDTGLTTNVFLTEPRLYGLRVTKEWTGEGWWTGANPNHPAGEPYPLTVELGGQVQRHDAPSEKLVPGWYLDNAGHPQFPTATDPLKVQNRNLDWGDGRQVRFTYRPSALGWWLAAGVRSSRTNSETARLHQGEIAGQPACLFSRQWPIPQGKALCDPTYEFAGYPAGHFYNPGALVTPVNWSDATWRDREENLVVDFEVGRDVGLGALNHSQVSAGLRYARLRSSTQATMNGITNLDLPEGFFKYLATSDALSASLDAEREFQGAGPSLSWDAAQRLIGNDAAGHFDIDWSATGGVLFGRQRTSINGVEKAYHFHGKYYGTNSGAFLDNVTPTPVAISRSKSATVPLVDLSLGLSYEIQRLKIATGYRWERYFNAMDGGDREHKSYDRTTDGPYFKIAVGFGG